MFFRRLDRRVRIIRELEPDGEDAPGNGELAINDFVRRKGKDRGVAGAQIGDVARHRAVPGEDDDLGVVQRIGQRDRGRDRLLPVILEERVLAVAGPAAALDPAGDAVEHLDALHRIPAARGFAGQHDGVGLLENSVRHIGHFRPGRERILDHRLEHLGRDDDRFADAQATFHDPALDNRQIFHRAFDPEIAARHEDDIGRRGSSCRDRGLRSCFRFWPRPRRRFRLFAAAGAADRDLLFSGRNSARRNPP